ncbi:helicase [Ktedonobacter sp. SOSP1-52]|uniref:ABC transporter ATP-binding protein n=1 Tax=Ktedonobacter sp. SOSP1-52 TaxID=2778366 RepID=UPI001916620F|nr:ABC transporter ATP-binding protein [Ktedonobacter sp. SOSP1-52]GHO66183.1 helicase [Ktedonobacter sp. SOSP1-52]
MTDSQHTATLTYTQLLRTYLGPQWQRMSLIILLLLSILVFQLVNPYILRYFIDTTLGGGDQSTLLLAGLLFVGLALLNQGATILETYVSENVAWTATNRLRADLVAHCLRLDLAFHKSHTSGELIERIDGDVDALSTFFSRSFVLVASNILLILGLILILFQQHWLVGLVMGIFALLATYILLRIRNFAIRSETEDRQKSAEFYGFMGEQLAGTSDIRANGATSYVLWRFYTLLRSWYPVNRRAAFMGFSTFVTTIAIFGIGNAMAFALGAYLWSQKLISPGAVYFIFYCTNLLNQPIDQIRRELQNLQKAGAGIERIRLLLRTQPTITDAPAPLSLPSAPLAVSFTSVSFSYNEQDTVLHDLSFDLAPGKILGLLGRTGSGKTTTARLLLRLYEAQSGEIRLGNVPIHATRLADLRQRVGMVTQDVQLFHASVRDNLTFFNASIPDSRILETLESLGLGPWLRSLPEGLNTELGSDGEGLSAGEAQLLAFTRIFLADPGLVILDEASSRLDPATEQLIEQATSKLLAGRTAIIIAHRLGTIQRADKIMVLEDGHILEQGARIDLANDPDSRFSYLLKTGLEEVLA